MADFRHENLVMSLTGSTSSGYLERLQFPR